MLKWTIRALVALVLLALLAAGALWHYGRQVLPQTSGEMAVTGLESDLSITRDAEGIPTIKAQSLRDVMFGLGFAHAQDRLWQLETHKRIGSGRLAEAFGEAALDNDRFLRSLAVRRTAQKQWDATQGESRVLLQAYAAGINAFVREHMLARPPEFLILGLQPQEWEPVDSMAWMIMMAWDLGANWSSELLRMRLAARLPLQRINELLPPYPGERPLALADYPALFRELQVDGRLARQAQAGAPSSGVEGAGSNNWVVAGSRTESGKPLLANDPHLKLSAPGLWYFARLEAPGFKVAGATMPGLPIVVLGQNDQIAWGFTNTNPDVQDLYLEQIKADDPTQYRTPEAWVPFETHEEVIRVRGAPDVKLTVRATRHGPVLPDGDGLEPRYAIAMRWTALDVPNTTLEAGLAFNRATSVDEFIKASSHYAAPMQNIVVADRGGQIAMVAAGKVPLRKATNDLKGQVPAPGWDARYDWAGYLDPAQTPREINPARGWIATANHRIHAPGYPHYITSEWALPYRQQRIEQLLAAKPRHTIESLAAIQGDVTSLATQRLLPHLRAAQARHSLAPQAHRQLDDFDGNMRADSAAPLIFWAWVRQLTEGLLADEIGTDLYPRLLGNRSFRDAVEGILARGDVWWCDDKSTPGVAETCRQQADAAFTRALHDLQEEYGSNLADWRWGRAHQARSEHRPFSHIRALAPFFELRTPVGGDTYTINVSRVSLQPDRTTGEFYLDDHGPGLRALYDLGEPSKSRFMHSTGQSGLMFSPLYRNFVDRWARGEYVPVWGTGEMGQALKLKPHARQPKMTP